MTDFTYEAKGEKNKLETYEWTRIWLESANTHDKKRVLYIGDSISAGTFRIATKRSNDEFLFDSIATSKGLDHPLFYDYISLFSKEEGERSCVIFNNGLHGWHLDDKNDYSEFYEKAIFFLLNEFPESKLFLVTTTALENPERCERVKVRNRVVASIAKKYSLPVIDLYSVSAENTSLRSSDGVHYTEAGYTLFADEIIKEIKKYIYK